MARFTASSNGFHLHRAANGEFYMNCYRAGKQTWRTSETYKRKAGAFGATFSLNDSLRDALGLEPLREKRTLNYIDHTGDEPVKHTHTCKN